MCCRCSSRRRRRRRRRRRCRWFVALLSLSISVKTARARAENRASNQSIVGSSRRGRSTTSDADWRHAVKRTLTKCKARKMAIDIIQCCSPALPLAAACRSLYILYGLYACERCLCTSERFLRVGLSLPDISFVCQLTDVSVQSLLATLLRQTSSTDASSQQREQISSLPVGEEARTGK